MEYGEGFEEGLKREIVEETGLEVSIAGYYGAVEDETDKFKVVHVVMKGACDGPDIRLSKEHDSFKWATLEEFAEIPLCHYLYALFGLEIRK